MADLFTNDPVPTDGHAGDGDDPPPSDGLLHLSPCGRRTQTPTGPEPAPRWKLLEERRLDPHRPAIGTYRRTSDLRISPIDPDATPMRIASRTSLGYHDHYVVDGGKGRIILAALVTPADVMENVPLRDLLWRIGFRRKLRPSQVTGDTTYGTTENIVALEDAGIRAFFPLPDFDQRTPFFRKSAFTYDAAADLYRCPQGQPLPRRKTKYTEHEVVYRAEAATCNACPVKAACTASGHGRIVHRSFYANYLEKVRGYHATEVYRKAMRKRKVWVEPLFAEAKDWHGLRRFRLRRLEKVNMEALLSAAGQNVKRLLAHSEWGRRPFPSGAAGTIPPALPHRPAFMP